MKLLTKHIHDKLLANGAKQDEVRGTAQEIDFHPVVKLFTPDGACTWLLTELDPESSDISFGLCDLGMGFPELGSVSMTELQSVRGLIGLPIERDKFFKASHTLSIYTRAASQAQRIVTDARALILATASKEAAR